ncbi:right-handed parallel beta-helix repeat-containing protein [Planctomycetota bacterium]
MKVKLLVLLLIISLFLCGCVNNQVRGPEDPLLADADEIALYVSPEGNNSWSGDSIDKPFVTIQKARDAIRSMKKESGLTQPVTVYIRGGLYELSETLVFTLEDSGTEACPITYTAYKNEEPVISGGRKITGTWKNYRGKIKVCTIDEVKKGKWYFRQLFLDGERQYRARIPNDSFHRPSNHTQLKGSFYRIIRNEEDLGNNAFMYQDQEFTKWKNLNDVEVVLIHSWNESRLLISELDEKEKVVTFTGPIGRTVGSDNTYYIENALELLDMPGEWYLDRNAGKLYYWPIEESNLSELRAPVINELVRFEGDVENKNYVQYINIHGLTFCDTDYILPKKGIPTIRDVGDIWFPSAVTLKGVSECVFENNTIRNTGTYGLDLTGDAIQVTGNEIYDTGSGGIITRSYGKHRNVIMYNHIHHCGAVLHSAVGINIDDGGGLIANNHIPHISHTGIYTRHFETDYGQEFQRRNQEQGLIIEYNEIHDCMLKQRDGGGDFCSR